MLNQRYRVTLVAFLAYFAMSGLLAPMGIVAGPMAETFDLPVATVAGSFGAMTTGILVGAALALVVYSWASVRLVLAVCYLVVFSGVLTVGLHASLSTAAGALAVVGTASGVGLAGAAIAITRLYVAERRASMLVVTDACFSLAGIVCSWVAASLMAEALHWSLAWSGVLVASAAILILLLLSRFPEHDPADSSGVAAGAVWPVPALLMLGGLFLYTLGQTSLLLWITQYAQQRFEMESASAGTLVSQYWTGLFAAQLFASWWVLKIGVRRLMLAAAVGALLCSLPLWLVTSDAYLATLMLLFGFANLGMLKVLLSLATEFIISPSPRLVSTLLLGASCGTAVAPVVSSTVAAQVSVAGVLWFTSACYAAILVLSCLALRWPAAAEVR